MWAKQTSQYNKSIYVYIKIFIIKEIYVCDYILFLNITSYQKPSLNIIGPKRGQRPLVFFFIICIDLKTMYIYNIMKIKNIIYCAHTGVDLGILIMGDVSWWHLNHSSRANISHTASMEWIIISPYSTSRKVRPYEPVVLYNHHHKTKVSS